MEITVNGSVHCVKPTLSYEEVVGLAEPVPDTLFTVTYCLPDGCNANLFPGQSVRVREDAVFNVMRTGTA